MGFSTWNQFISALTAVADQRQAHFYRKASITAVAAKS
jgi:hypothetical protein